MGEYVGSKFGLLTVVEIIDDKYCICKCECGLEKNVKKEYLKYGKTRSCGCLARGNHTTHGRTGTAEHKIWRSIKSRVLNPCEKDIETYGQISICQEWLDDFDAFFSDMGKRPSTKHQIDRIDNTKGYNKDNCRWATPKENARNRRTSRWWYINGKRYESCTHAGEELGIHPQMVVYHCNGPNPKPGWYSELKYRDAS